MTKGEKGICFGLTRDKAVIFNKFSITDTKCLNISMSLSFSNSYMSLHCGALFSRYFASYFLIFPAILL